MSIQFLGHYRHRIAYRPRVRALARKSDNQDVAFLLGLLMGAVAVIWFIGFVVNAATLLPRVVTARGIVGVYETVSDQTAPVDNRPLSDIGDLSDADEMAVRKLYGLGITDGTGEATFAPYARTSVPQWLVLTGRLWAVLWGW